jgi:GT2 family glycosyltransferase
MSSDITAVVCHYNPTRHAYLQHLVNLCVATLRRVPDDLLTIHVCDGSPEPDPQLATTLSASQACYLHAGRGLSFGETYNLGIEAVRTEHVVLLANDILISSVQVRRLVAEVRGDVACTIPYLTRSDYVAQTARRSRVPPRCYPASMTLNVNAFRSDVLRGVGGVPEELSGCFNDAVMFQRLRNQGYRIALVNVGHVDHLRAITRLFSSDLNFDRDLATAPSLAPDLFHGIRPKQQKNTWARLYANAAQRPLSRLLWRLVGWVPWELSQHRGLGSLAAWLEPYLACMPADYRRALLRSPRRPG